MSGRSNGLLTCSPCKQATIYGLTHPLIITTRENGNKMGTYSYYSASSGWGPILIYGHCGRDSHLCHVHSYIHIYTSLITVLMQEILVARTAMKMLYATHVSVLVACGEVRYGSPRHVDRKTPASRVGNQRFRKTLPGFSARLKNKLEPASPSGLQF